MKVEQSYHLTHSELEDIMNPQEFKTFGEYVLMLRKYYITNKWLLTYLDISKRTFIRYNTNQHIPQRTVLLSLHLLLKYKQLGL